MEKTNNPEPLTHIGIIRAIVLKRVRIHLYNGRTTEHTIARCVDSKKENAIIIYLSNPDARYWVLPYPYAMQLAIKGFTSRITGSLSIIPEIQKVRKNERDRIRRKLQK